MHNDTNLTLAQSQSHRQGGSQVMIVGDCIDAITTAVVMASLGHQVSYINPTKTAETVIAAYQFEYQLYALWQLYVSQHKISVYTEDSIIQQVAAANLHTAVMYVWLFIDSATELTQIEKNSLSQAGIQVIISGIRPIGDIHGLARKIHNPHVFYIPFVFLEDSASFASMLKPKLFLVGEKTADTAQQLKLIMPLYQQARHAAVADIKTIEFTRSSIMTMLATRLSFVNEMARLADAYQLDIKQVSRLMGLDERIGSSYLNASWGFGGNTLPSEIAAMQHSFAHAGAQNKLIQAVADINEDQKELIFRKFWCYFDGFITGKQVVVWGAGYKAGSGRTQNSAIHPLMYLLWQHEVTTLVFDSNANAELAYLYADEDKHQLIDDAYTQLARADALFIINWSEPVPPNLSVLLSHPLPVFDAQNLLNREQIDQLTGFYTGIGQGQSI